MNDNINIDEIHKLLISFLNKRKIKHKFNIFPSGNIMIDIWYQNDFYVLQIENELLGISKIDNDNPGFDTKPDKMFSSLNELFDYFKDLFDDDN